MQASQSSVEGGTPGVSHYSSYPAPVGAFWAPDAPEHSPLVNTPLALIPHLDAHTSSYFSTDGRTIGGVGGSNSIYCQDFFKAVSWKHLIKALSEMEIRLLSKE